MVLVHRKPPTTTIYFPVSLSGYCSPTSTSFRRLNLARGRAV